MESVDRTSWVYTHADGSSAEEYIDQHELRCMICTEGFSDAVALVGCGHVFCRSCVEAWFETQGQARLTCPLDRNPVESRASLLPPPLDLSAALARLWLKCECGFAGEPLRHSECPLLRCPFADSGCFFHATDKTAKRLHAKECAFRDTWCAECFPEGRSDRIHPARTPAPEHHDRATCTYISPLLTWSPSLSFLMTPTDLVRALYVPRLRRPDDGLPMLVHSAMPLASEITSFECRYHWVPYRHAIRLFHPSIQLPSPYLVSQHSYVCFMFQLNYGLRLISIRLHPAHYQVVDALNNSVSSFMEANGMPETHPISVGRLTPECITMVGKNSTTTVGEVGEINIEFQDARVEVKGGTRVHSQMGDFVHWME
ncbi:hypothetical protein HDU81_003940 [Chytriomyces hyalinus]|nr:hypothetical protein HDU81_003940 [Chytriomyces hyalinus]